MPTAAMGRVPPLSGRQFGRMRTPSSLGAKLVLIITAVGLVAAVAITLLLAAIIMPSFTTIENHVIAGHVERTRTALSDYAARVESIARDYGDEDEGYAFMTHPDAARGRTGFLARAMRNTDIDGMAYVTAEGRIVVARWHDPVRGLDRPAMAAGLAATIHSTNLATLIGDRASHRFYARIGDRVAAIGVARIRQSDGTGASRGYVLVARSITSQEIADLLGFDARIDPHAQGDAISVTPGGSRLAIGVPLIGADGHAVADTRFSVRRDVTLLGRRMLLLAVAGSTLLLLLVLIVLRWMIARLVLRPLRRIERQMQRVRASGSLALLEDNGRRDEIGALGRSFNAMLRQLKDLREQVEVQSFDLGRSESAVAVMHNVRNALNPISTILSQGIAQIPPIDHATVDRAIAELVRADIPAARRQTLAAFVAAAIEAESASREATRRELVVGREAMAHVLEIIGEQQHAAHERPAIEVCDVTDIIARNATIARYAQGASIAFSFPAGPCLALASRVILSQVIGNLFGNAIESIAAHETGSGSIVATITSAGGLLTIEIRDDGAGFSPDIAATLFQRGFSTRGDKSGGLGLHWSANAVNAMQGSLRLESEGPGLGAVAILTLRAGAAAMAKAA